MASVCMYLVLWKYFYKGNFFRQQIWHDQNWHGQKAPPPPPTHRPYIHVPGSYGHFENYFLVHYYAFYNFKMAITPKLSEIEISLKIQKLFHIWSSEYFLSNFHFC